MLKSKSKVFYQMGMEQFKKYPKHKIAKNKEFRLVVGYVLEQSLELMLKHICYKFTLSYPEKHKLYILCNKIKENVYEKQFDGKKDLIEMLDYFDVNTRQFDKLSYSAKYNSNELEFSMEELLNLIQQLERVYSWWNRYGARIFN